jgi:hypothetical protein
MTMPEKMTTDEMVNKVLTIDSTVEECKQIIVRLREADKMEAWIKHTYGDWTDEPDGEKP